MERAHNNRNPAEQVNSSGVNNNHLASNSVANNSNPGTNPNTNSSKPKEQSQGKQQQQQKLGLLMSGKPLLFDTFGTLQSTSNVNNKSTRSNLATTTHRLGNNNNSISHNNRGRSYYIPPTRNLNEVATTKFAQTLLDKQLLVVPGTNNREAAPITNNSNVSRASTTTNNNIDTIARNNTAGAEGISSIGSHGDKTDTTNAADRRPSLEKICAAVMHSNEDRDKVPDLADRISKNASERQRFGGSNGGTSTGWYPASWLRLRQKEVPLQHEVLYDFRTTRPNSATTGDNNSSYNYSTGGKNSVMSSRAPSRPMSASNFLSGGGIGMYSYFGQTVDEMVLSGNSNNNNFNTTAMSSKPFGIELSAGGPFDVTAGNFSNAGKSSSRPDTRQKNTNVVTVTIGEAYNTSGDDLTPTAGGQRGAPAFHPREDLHLREDSSDCHPHINIIGDASTTNTRPVSQGTYASLNQPNSTSNFVINEGTSQQSFFNKNNQTTQQSFFNSYNNNYYMGGASQSSGQNSYNASYTAGFKNGNNMMTNTGNSFRSNKNIRYGNNANSLSASASQQHIFIPSGINYPHNVLRRVEGEDNYNPNDNNNALLNPASINSINSSAGGNYSNLNYFNTHNQQQYNRDHLVHPLDSFEAAQQHQQFERRIHMSTAVANNAPRKFFAEQPYNIARGGQFIPTRENFIPGTNMNSTRGGRTIKLLQQDPASRPGSAMMSLTGVVPDNELLHGQWRNFQHYREHLVPGSPRGARHEQRIITEHAQEQISKTQRHVKSKSPDRSLSRSASGSRSPSAEHRSRRISPDNADKSRSASPDNANNVNNNFIPANGPVGNFSRPWSAPFPPGSARTSVRIVRQLAEKSSMNANANINDNTRNRMDLNNNSLSPELNNVNMNAQPVVFGAEGNTIAEGNGVEQTFGGQFLGQQDQRLPFSAQAGFGNFHNSFQLNSFFQKDNTYEQTDPSIFKYNNMGTNYGGFNNYYAMGDQNSNLNYQTKNNYANNFLAPEKTAMNRPESASTEAGVHAGMLSATYRSTEATSDGRPFTVDSSSSRPHYGASVSHGFRPGSATTTADGDNNNYNNNKSEPRLYNNHDRFFPPLFSHTSRTLSVPLDFFVEEVLPGSYYSPKLRGYTLDEKSERLLIVPARTTNRKKEQLDDNQTELGVYESLYGKVLPDSWFWEYLNDYGFSIMDLYKTLHGFSRYKLSMDDRYITPRHPAWLYNIGELLQLSPKDILQNQNMLQALADETDHEYKKSQKDSICSYVFRSPEQRERCNILFIPKEEFFVSVRQHDLYLTNLDILAAKVNRRNRRFVNNMTILGECHNSANTNDDNLNLDSTFAGGIAGNNHNNNTNSNTNTSYITLLTPPSALLVFENRIVRKLLRDRLKNYSKEYLHIVELASVKYNHLFQLKSLDKFLFENQQIYDVDAFFGLLKDKLESIVKELDTSWLQDFTFIVHYNNYYRERYGAQPRVNQYYMEKKYIRRRERKMKTHQRGGVGGASMIMNEKTGELEEDPKSATKQPGVEDYIDENCYYASSDDSKGYSSDENNNATTKNGEQQQVMNNNAINMNLSAEEIIRRKNFSNEQLNKNGSVDYSVVPGGSNNFQIMHRHVCEFFSTPKVKRKRTKKHTVDRLRREFLEEEFGPVAQKNLLRPSTDVEYLFNLHNTRVHIERYIPVLLSLQFRDVMNTAAMKFGKFVRAFQTEAITPQHVLECNGLEWQVFSSIRLDPIMHRNNPHQMGSAHNNNSKSSTYYGSCGRQTKQPGPPSLSSHVSSEHRNYHSSGNSSSKRPISPIDVHGNLTPGSGMQHNSLLDARHSPNNNAGNQITNSLVGGAWSPLAMIAQSTSLAELAREQLGKNSVLISASASPSSYKKENMHESSNFNNTSQGRFNPSKLCNNSHSLSPTSMNNQNNRTIMVGNDANRNNNTCSRGNTEDHDTTWAQDLMDDLKEGKAPACKISMVYTSAGKHLENARKENALPPTNEEAVYNMSKVGFKYDSAYMETEFTKVVQSFMRSVGSILKRAYLQLKLSDPTGGHSMPGAETGNINNNADNNNNTNSNSKESSNYASSKNAGQAPSSTSPQDDTSSPNARGVKNMSEKDGSENNNNISNRQAYFAEVLEETFKKLQIIEDREKNLPWKKAGSTGTSTLKKQMMIESGGRSTAGPGSKQKDNTALTGNANESMTRRQLAAKLDPYKKLLLTKLFLAKTDSKLNGIVFEEKQEVEEQRYINPKKNPKLNMAMRNLQYSNTSGANNSSANDILDAKSTVSGQTSTTNYLPANLAHLPTNASEQGIDGVNLMKGTSVISNSAVCQKAKPTNYRLPHPMKDQFDSKLEKFNEKYVDVYKKKIYNYYLPECSTHQIETTFKKQIYVIAGDIFKNNFWNAAKIQDVFQGICEILTKFDVEELIARASAQLNAKQRQAESLENEKKNSANNNTNVESPANNNSHPNSPTDMDNITKSQDAPALLDPDDQQNEDSTKDDDNMNTIQNKKSQASTVTNTLVGGGPQQDLAIDSSYGGSKYSQFQKLVYSCVPDLNAVVSDFCVAEPGQIKDLMDKLKLIDSVVTSNRIMLIRAQLFQVDTQELEIDILNACRQKICRILDFFVSQNHEKNYYLKKQFEFLDNVFSRRPENEEDLKIMELYMHNFKTEGIYTNLHRLFMNVIAWQNFFLDGGYIASSCVFYSVKSSTGGKKKAVVGVGSGNNNSNNVKSPEQASQDNNPGTTNNNNADGSTGIVVANPDGNSNTKSADNNATGGDENINNNNTNSNSPRKLDAASANDGNLTDMNNNNNSNSSSSGTDDNNVIIDKSKSMASPPSSPGGSPRLLSAAPYSPGGQQGNSSFPKPRKTRRLRSNKNLDTQQKKQWKFRYLRENNNLASYYHKISHTGNSATTTIPGILKKADFDSTYRNAVKFNGLDNVLQQKEREFEQEGVKFQKMIAEEYNIAVESIAKVKKDVQNLLFLDGSIVKQAELHVRALNLLSENSDDVGKNLEELVLREEQLVECMQNRRTEKERRAREARDKEKEQLQEAKGMMGVVAKEQRIIDDDKSDRVHSSRAGSEHEDGQHSGITRATRSGLSGGKKGEEGSKEKEAFSPDIFSSLPMRPEELKMMDSINDTVNTVEKLKKIVNFLKSLWQLASDLNSKIGFATYRGNWFMTPVLQLDMSTVERDFAKYQTRFQELGDCVQTVDFGSLGLSLLKGQENSLDAAGESGMKSPDRSPGGKVVAGKGFSPGGPVKTASKEIPGAAGQNNNTSFLAQVTGLDATMTSMGSPHQAGMNLGRQQQENLLIVNNLDKTALNDILNSMRKSVSDFDEKFLPLLRKFCNADLQNKHWVQISKAIDYPDFRDTKFNLNFIFESNLFALGDQSRRDLETISRLATEEGDVLRKLDEIRGRKLVLGTVKPGYLERVECYFTADKLRKILSPADDDITYDDILSQRSSTMRRSKDGTTSYGSPTTTILGSPGRDGVAQNSNYVDNMGTESIANINKITDSTTSNKLTSPQTPGVTPPQSPERKSQQQPWSSQNSKGSSGGRSARSGSLTPPEASPSSAAKAVVAAPSSGKTESAQEKSASDHNNNASNPTSSKSAPMPAINSVADDAGMRKSKTAQEMMLGGRLVPAQPDSPRSGLQTRQSPKKSRAGAGNITFPAECLVPHVDDFSVHRRTLVAFLTFSKLLQFFDQQLADIDALKKPYYEQMLQDLALNKNTEFSTQKSSKAGVSLGPGAASQYGNNNNFVDELGNGVANNVENNTRSVVSFGDDQTNLSPERPEDSSTLVPGEGTALDGADCVGASLAPARLAERGDELPRNAETSNDVSNASEGVTAGNEEAENNSNTKDAAKGENNVDENDNEQQQEGMLLPKGAAASMADVNASKGPSAVELASQAELATINSPGKRGYRRQYSALPQKFTHDDVQSCVLRIFSGMSEVNIRRKVEKKKETLVLYIEIVKLWNFLYPLLQIALKVDRTLFPKNTKTKLMKAQQRMRKRELDAAKRAFEDEKRQAAEQGKKKAAHVGLGPPSSPKKLGFFAEARPGGHPDAHVAVAGGAVTDSSYEAAALDTSKSLKFLRQKKAVKETLKKSRASRPTDSVTLANPFINVKNRRTVNMMADRAGDYYGENEEDLGGHDINNQEAKDEKAGTVVGETSNKNNDDGAGQSENVGNKRTLVDTSMMESSMMESSIPSVADVDLETFGSGVTGNTGKSLSKVDHGSSEVEKKEDVEKQDSGKDETNKESEDGGPTISTNVGGEESRQKSKDSDGGKGSGENEDADDEKGDESDSQYIDPRRILVQEQSVEDATLLLSSAVSSCLDEAQGDHSQSANPAENSVFLAKKTEDLKPLIGQCLLAIYRESGKRLLNGDAETADPANSTSASKGEKKGVIFASDPKDASESLHDLQLRGKDDDRTIAALAREDLEEDGDAIKTATINAGKSELFAADKLENLEMDPGQNFETLKGSTSLHPDDLNDGNDTPDRDNANSAASSKDKTEVSDNFSSDMANTNDLPSSRDVSKENNSTDGNSTNNAANPFGELAKPAQNSSAAARRQYQAFRESLAARFATLEESFREITGYVFHDESVVYESDEERHERLRVDKYVRQNYSPDKEMFLDHLLDKENELRELKTSLEALKDRTVKTTLSKSKRGPCPLKLAVCSREEGSSALGGVPFKIDGRNANFVTNYPLGNAISDKTTASSANNLKPISLRDLVDASHIASSSTSVEEDEFILAVCDMSPSKTRRIDAAAEDELRQQLFETSTAKRKSLDAKDDDNFSKDGLEDYCIDEIE